MNYLLQHLRTLENPPIHVKEHPEANEYGGCEFSFEGKKYLQRTAKITPKKVGQFVTLWKRNEEGITAPYDSEDDFDYVVILCQCQAEEGCFLFPKSILVERHYLSNPSLKVEGKRGFRVYPRWDVAPNKQAVLTQAWQARYFSSMR